MLAYIAYDIKNWMDEQFKNKASSSEDEWLRKLTSVVDRMREHVHASPETFAAAGAAAPDEAAKPA